MMTTISHITKRGRPSLPVASKCGTTTGYAQGCRCERCRTAWATYQREYNARPDVQTRRALKLLGSTPEGREALTLAASAAAEREHDAAVIDEAATRDAWMRDTLL